MSTSAVGRPVQLVRWQRAAADPRSAACTLAFGSIVVLGFLDGGYYPSTWSWAAVALVAIAGIQVVLGRAASPSRLALISSTALAALAAWMLLSSTWGVDGTEAGREAQRALTYAAALVALLSVSRAATARALLAGTLGGILVLAAFGLGARVLGAPQIDPFQGALLKEPVGYANSLGILTAIGVVVAVGLALEASGSPRRSAFLGAAGISGLALALTSSRGAWLALVVGLGVLASARVRSAWIVGALAAAGAVLVLVAITHVPLGDRPAYWRVAAEDFSQHRLLGSGAGSFADVRLDARPIPAYVRDAHNAYLETAAELGLVGLCLLLAVLAAPLVAAARRRRDPVIAIAAGGYSAFLVHLGLDWDWEMPVTVLAGLACAATLLAARPQR